MKKNFQQFSVLLLRPDYVSGGVEVDTFFAHVDALTVELAQSVAQAQAAEADAEEDFNPNPADYIVLLAVPGHVQDVKVIS